MNFLLSQMWIGLQPVIDEREAGNLPISVDYVKIQMSKHACKNS